MEQIKLKKQFKKYPDYKESGIDWIGEIPRGWEVMKFKNISRIINGSTPRSDNPNFWDGQICWITPDDLSNTDAKYISASKRSITEEGYESCGTNLVPKGSMILSTRAPIGLLAINTVSACTNQGCKAIVPNKKMLVDYCYYLVKSAVGELNNLGTGTTFLELSRQKLADFQVVTPSKIEQEKIAKHLDEKTELIDQIVSKKKKFIELLKEKRLALINKAVTKGLDENVKMVDSGINWIGEIPKGWSVFKLKQISRIETGSTPSKTEDGFYSADNGSPWVKPDNLTEFIPVIESKEKLSESGAKFARLVPKGSVLVNCIGDIGKIGIAGINLATNQQINSVIFSRKVDENLGKYLIYASKEEMKARSNSVVVSILNKTQQGNIEYAIGPYDDQKKIATYLDKKTKSIDDFINKIGNSIEFLNEYKSSLISSVVTGKILI